MADPTQRAVLEPARHIPIIHECDICVLGGSCTGLFAAVRAARLGARVCIVEKQNCFGGVATISMVNAWHSLADTEFRQPIIAGLTEEVITRLQKRNAIRIIADNSSMGSVFNSEELKIELDELAQEHRLKIYFHTVFCQPILDGDRVDAVLVENKSGRGAIRARQFVDATGDGDLCARLPGLECYFANHLQPSTTCARFTGWPKSWTHGKNGFSIGRTVQEHGHEVGLEAGFMWGCEMPPSDVYMLAGTRVIGSNPADADQLTDSEIEGRRQVRAIMDLVRTYGPGEPPVLQALPSRIGLRESRHVRCGYQLTEQDVLTGRRFDDAIANGSYRVDIHHQDKPGITLRYLDGQETYSVPGEPKQVRRWREQTSSNPTFYQIPLRSMRPNGPIRNVILAGRMIDADPGAHGAIRVMVNMNQTGEAAGVAAWLALDGGVAVGDVQAADVRRVLGDGGSIVL